MVGEFAVVGAFFCAHDVYGNAAFVFIVFIVFPDSGGHLSYGQVEPPSFCELPATPVAIRLLSVNRAKTPESIEKDPLNANSHKQLTHSPSKTSHFPDRISCVTVKKMDLAQAV